ncbi:unnamed protein product [Toxocara canis]|uniref:TIR domain-containing protein n=1 Tax=Toxocara canis TaxID=6265 RepID=A0A183VG94_TOXCA|nr:unnamed protein product [Toxocara canis]
MAMNTVDLQSQIKYISTLNVSTVKVFVAYAGRDPFIEAELSKHFANSFIDVEHLTCKSGLPNEKLTFDQIRKLVEEGKRHIAVYFPEDDHFIQKHRAKLLADTIHILLSDEKKRQERKEVSA